MGGGLGVIFVDHDKGFLDNFVNLFLRGTG